jgi:hypothetical protein
MSGESHIPENGDPSLFEVKGKTGTGSVDLYSSASFSHENFGLPFWGIAW